MKHHISVLVIVLAVVPAGAESKTLLAASRDGVPHLEPSTPAPVVMNEARGVQWTYTSRVLFRANHGNVLPLEDYENGNVPAGGISACASPMNGATNDPACVDPGDILPGFETASVSFPGASGLAMLGAGFAGNPTRTVVSNYFTDSTNINLDATTRGGCWGADLQAFLTGVPLTVSFFDPANVLTGSYTVPSSSSGVFFGVIDGQDDIARVNISDPTGANAEGADRQEWGPGPIFPVDLQSFVVE